MDQLRNFLALLRTQLWPVPALFALGATGLAFVLLEYGNRLRPDGRAWWVFSGDPGTGRDLLGSLLGGLMTMTSLVVSVTFVILTLAANQLGPRLISIFMGDRQIQSVLGLFIGTILYVILVLRTLDDSLGSEAMPHVAVTVASALTVSCLLALLFYIHKIARSIIADNVVEAVSRGLRRTLRDILPEQDSKEDAPATEPFRGRCWPLGVGTVGYVQVVDYQRLLTLACDADLKLAVNVRAGHYLLREGEHINVYSDEPPDESLRERIRSAFTVGIERTPAQDPENGIRQLTEIATRALSPGINDPFTAIAVIDRLAAALEDVFARDLQPVMLFGPSNERRVIANRSDMPGLLAAAFHPIRQAGQDNPAILIHMAEVLGELGWAAAKPMQRQALAGQLKVLAETAALQEFAEQDREDVRASIARAERRLVSAPADRRNKGPGLD